MAQSLIRSRDLALGGFYRRLAARRGGLVATKALARKPRVLILDEATAGKKLDEAVGFGRLQ